jgi:prepilin-type N-terminal cleavage/methylation domain-containing protein
MPVSQGIDRHESNDMAGFLARLIHRRSAFTLVEMLVALSIVLFLGAITVTFLPTVQEKQRVARGASLLQGWLATAKNLAIRDGAPRGVRIRGKANASSNLITSCQYVEQPDDLFQGGSLSLSAPGAYDATTNTYPYTLTGTGVDFQGGFDATDPTKWPIQPGDFLEISGLTPSATLRFLSVTDSTHATVAWESSGFDDPTTPPGPPSNPPASQTLFTNKSIYTIIRQPRVRVGTAPLDLPESVAIDVSTNTTYQGQIPAKNPVTQNVEILFSPAGQVIGLGSGADKIQLWLRDTSADSTANVVMTPALDPNATFQGDQVLVTIYVRTGSIAASTVNTVLNGATPQQYADPYAFTRDGRSSGL